MSLRRWALLLVAGLAACHAAKTPSGTPAAARVSCGPAIQGEAELDVPLVVVGETHGTAEIPALFGGLVCRAATGHAGQPILVGLEIDSSAQPALDAFLDSSGGADAERALTAHAFWHRSLEDGRSSKAGLALLDSLRRLRASGAKVMVRAIDPPKTDSAAARDASMAANVVAAIAEVRPVHTFVLVGDVHSRVLPGYPWAPADPYIPMGAHLRAKYPEMIGLGFRAFGGSAWTCDMDMRCGATDLKAREPDGPTPRIQLDPDALPKVGWSGRLFVGHATASPPAVTPSSGSSPS